MNISLRLILIILFTFCLHCAHAQDSQNSIELSGTAGLNIFTPQKDLISGNVYGFEGAYHFGTANMKSPFVKALNLQSIDIVASYRNMEGTSLTGVPDTKGILGSNFGVLGRIEIGVAQAGPVKLLFTPGFGLGYSTQTYFTNHKDIVVGSHLNAALQVGLKLYTPVTASTGIQAGVDLFHYSNGGSRIPNQGVNAYSVSLGIVQKLRQPGMAKGDSTGHYYKSSFEIGGDLGSRGVFESRDVLGRSGLYAGYNYQLSHVFSLKLASDAVYYFTDFNPAKYNYTFQNYGTSYDRWRVGLSLGGDLWLGRLALMGNYGHYLHFASYYPNNQWYWTTGFKYYVTPWLGVQMKTYFHHTQADYVGYGLLFRIHT